MHKMIELGSMVLSLLILAPYGFADEGTTQEAGTHMKVSGVVSKTQSGLVTVKTSWGSMTFSLPGSEKLKVGEEVEMQVNENNAVIDVHRKGGRLIPIGMFRARWPIRLPIDEKSSSGRLKERKPLTCRRDDPS